MKPFSEAVEIAREHLINPHKYSWTLQGLGMLRAYLGEDKVYRLHVWSVDPNDKFGADSDIHTHPWDFESLVISGEIQNILFEEGRGEWFNSQMLTCGTGGCVKGPVERVRLAQLPIQVVQVAQGYFQRSHEIHKSLPSHGAVTLVRRDFVNADTETARVFWPDGKEWTSAEPRVASSAEVDRICKAARDAWTSL